MKPRRRNKLDSQLKRKGFISEERDHTFYFLHYKNQKTSVYTKLSHSISEYGNNLLSQMARQLSLTNSEFENFLECPMTYDNLIEKLKERKRIES